MLAARDVEHHFERNDHFKADEGEPLAVFYELSFLATKDAQTLKEIDYQEQPEDREW